MPSAKDNLKETNDIVYTEDSIKMYLREINKHKLLTKEEEKDLSNKLKNSEEIKLLEKTSKDDATIPNLNINLFLRSLSNTSNYDFIIKTVLSYYECSSKYANKKIIDILNKYQCISLNLSRPLNEEELLLNFGILPGDNSLDEKELLKETQKFITYKTSFDKFLLSNLKFVVFIAKKFDYNIDLLDLINEGNIGLIKAIKKYDNSMGGFANYASWWIKSAIQQTYNSSKFSLNLSQHQIDALTDFKRRYMELTIKEGRKLETKEIAEKLSIPIEKVEKNFELMNSIVSLDAPIDELKEKNIGSLVISEEDTEQSAYNDSLNQELHLLFNEVLNENEIRIIKMKYGLDEYENNQIQIEKIAEELTLPKGKVKMMEQSALFKMRRHINTNNDNRCLREYLK